MKHISKLLSLVLRHQPDVLGIQLDEQGWTDVTILLDKMKRRVSEINLDLLKIVVATNDKQLFIFNSDFSKIRANQGHSIDIDLALPPAIPPAYLYHGTAEKNLQSIFAEGINKGTRQYVHLSLDKETALKVGQRHGKPTIIVVRSGQMHEDGILFYLSENNVWLTDFVAAKYLETKH